MKISGIILAAAAVLVFCPAVRAAEIVPPKTAVPTAASAPAALAASATAQAAVPCPESCDYDALSAVNDPLYREGSREFLKQVIQQAQPAQGGAKPAVKPEYRDAPNSSPASAAPAAGKTALPHPAIKKPSGRKAGPADPVKVKNTL